MTKSNNISDEQVSSDADDEQPNLKSVEDYWYRSLTTRGVDPDAAERIIRAAQSHPVLVSGDPSKDEIESLTREGINMVDLAGEGIEEPERVREEMREALLDGLDGKIPGPMSLTTPYDVQVASATGPSGEVATLDSGVKAEFTTIDSETTSDQTSTGQADGDEVTSQETDSDGDSYEALITRTFSSHGEAELETAEELGYKVANASEAQAQTALDDEIVAEFTDRIEEFESATKSEAARALGVLVTLRDTNTKENTARELLERVEENPAQQAYTQALGKILSYHDDLTLHEKSVHVGSGNNASGIGQEAVRGSNQSVDTEGTDQPDDLPGAVKTGKNEFVRLIENGEITPEEFKQMYHEVMKEISSDESE